MLSIKDVNWIGEANPDMNTPKQKVSYVFFGKFNFNSSSSLLFISM